MTRLVIPHDVEGLIVDLLQRRHPEHLAEQERARGMSARTYETFATIARMSDAQGLRLSGDTVPACLLGVIGAPSFRRNERDEIDAVMQLGMQITVMGKRRADTLLRRDVMAFTVIECLYQRLPRTGLVSDVELVDYEPLASADTQRTLGDARLVWELGVPAALAIVGGLPVDDTPLAPGSPGGPPAGPYEPPEAAPVAGVPTFTVDRQPLIE